ncbi:MAG TPA: FG-GAP-like repeat-containing protein [Rhizomicrobium sp.]|nr:FG-GAP-like repeat-containing protein [Rhizomicrobium sp.]
MAIIINNIKPKAANGTSGANPTNGANGLAATNTQSGAIMADSIFITTEGGEGGDGGNGAGVPGANGGNGGNASITVNGNIINGAPGTTLTIDLHGNGGAGGLGGTGTPNGQMGNGGNSTVTANGNIIQPNKIMTLIELKARAHSGNGTVKGNATATLNGNIIQNSKLTSAVVLQAQAFTHGADAVANHGNLNFGTKTATVNGNIVQGNINNVTVSADAYYSNGTANLNGNIIQTNASNTGAVNLEATGNKIVITNNKVQLGLQSLTLTINNNAPYDTTIQNNEFKGTGLNAFTFADYAFPGPHTDTVSINLANQTFVFNGQSNILMGFNSVTVLGNVSATLTGDGNDNILYGSDGDDVIDGGGGNDIIYGGLGQDTLTGGQGNDELHGNDGNDILDGGLGDDLLFGGAGDDILLVSGGTDVLDGMTDPLGDTASFINATAGVNANNGNAQQDFTAQGLGLVTLLNIQNLIGSNYNDILTGDGVGNYLAGGNGDDRLIGVGGNDTLNGDANTDTAVYSGNYGIDYTVAVNNSGNGTVTDTRMGSPDGADTLSSIEFIEFANGTFNTATQTFVPNGPVNTAPVLNAAQTPVLAAVTEDAGVPVGAVGTLVSSLVDFAVPPGQVDNVTDPDMGAQLGIALTGTGANGTWYYSTDNGTSWNLVGAVSDASARLLAADANSRIYFQPNADFDGSSNVTFRAWDQTSGVNGGLGNATLNGGTTAFSAASDTANVTVTPVNDAPVLNAAATPAFASVPEDAAPPGLGSGTLISALVDFASPSGQVDNVTDPDSGAVLGIAVTATDESNGLWYYSLNGGNSWTAVGLRTDATALLLSADANTRLAFQPNADFNGTVPSGITFRAWDQTSGVNGGTANTTMNGGATAFSTATDTAAITVTAVNDAPVLNAAASPALTSVVEDAGAPVGAVGTLISSLVDFPGGGGLDNVTDVDAGALLGIALTGTDSANGVWHYSTDNGTSWNLVGAVSDATALLLAADANTRLYFQPNADFNGAVPAGITFRAWDQTSGVNGGTADASINGGTTAFSTANDTASISVTAVNDAPVLNAAASPALADGLQNNPAPVGAVGSLVSSLVDLPGGGGLDNVTDVDTGAVTGIAITATDSANGTWWYSTNNGTTWNMVGAVANNSARLLAADANTRLYFQPNMGFSGPVPNGITFRAWDQTSGVNGSLADTSVNGGTTAFSSVTDTASITINGGENYFGTNGDDNHTGTAFDDIMHVSASTTTDILDGAGHILGDTLTFDTVINNGVNYTINTLSGIYETAGGFGQTNAVNFEHLTGSSLDDILTGDALTNTIDGSGGDDVLVGTAGGDTLIGGANTIVGDTADFSGAATNGVTADLFAGTASGADFGSVTLSGIENLTGTNFADSLTGDGNNNVLNGGGGADTLTGGLGDDTLNGGSGIDTAVFSTQPAAGDVSWNGSAFVVTGPDGTDTLTNVEQIDDPGLGSRILLVGGGGYATINAAIAAASNGDTILIAPGTYAENVVVNKEVTLQGLGAPGSVVIQGSFATDNPTLGATPVNEFLRTNAYSGASGSGILVSANNVTLSNLTVEYFLNAVETGVGSYSGLTLDGMILQHSVFGFAKPNSSELTGLSIDGSTFSDSYIGVYFYNNAFATAAASDAINSSITDSLFQDITQKGIYAETLQGNTLFDGLTMNNVGEYGGGVAFGANGAHGAGIDANLKFNTYTGSLTISDFDFDDVGSSTGLGTPHVNAAAIAIKGRDDPGHPTYGANPADVSGLTVTIQDGSIDGTSTGIRAGEANKATPADNVTGPAVTIDDVEIVNNIADPNHGQIDNHTQSLMTVNGTSGDDTYQSAQTAVSSGPIVFYGFAGNDYLLGGTGNDIFVGGEDDDTLDGGSDGTDAANYSDATEDGLVVDLTAGTSSGGGLGNDTLYNIDQVYGSIYNDTLVGDAADNLLSGDDGNDVLYGHGATGLNVLLGGNGTDVAYYAGLETDYVAPSIFGVTGGPESVSDILVDMERLKFLSPSHVSDVDSNGLGNLIFRNAVTGNLEIRESPASLISVGGIGGNNWRVAGTGQFDPDLDRTADILLQDQITGDLKVLTEVGGANTQTLLDTQPGSPQWVVVGTGDFNGDAASDILLRNSATQATEIMFLNTESTDPVGTVADTVALTSPGANWRAMAAGDFNGDGKSDIFWQNTATKQVQIHLMNGSNVTNTPLTQAAAGLTAIGTGDFNGDGNSDLLFKNVAGQAVLWFMYGDIHTGTKTIGKPGAIAALGVSGALDVDGNGYSDVIWNDPATGNTRATLLGGPSSLVNTTVLNSNFTMPNSASPTFQLVASTGGG